MMGLSWLIVMGGVQVFREVCFGLLFGQIGFYFMVGVNEPGLLLVDLLFFNYSRDVRRIAVFELIVFL